MSYRAYGNYVPGVGFVPSQSVTYNPGTGTAWTSGGFINGRFVPSQRVSCYTSWNGYITVPAINVGNVRVPSQQIPLRR